MRKMRTKHRKLSFLNKVRISYWLLIMIPVLVFEVFVLHSSTRFIREQQKLEVEGNIDRNYQNIENQIGACEKSVLYVISNRTLWDFLNTTDDQYMIRAQSASNVSSLLYNILLTNQYFADMKIYSDKNIAVSNAIFKNIGELDDLSWYEQTMAANQSLWWHEDGKYYITRRIVSSLPEKQLAVVRVEIKESVFSDNVSIFTDVPLQIQVADQENVLFQYRNSSVSDNAEIGYESERELADTQWVIRYQIEKSYFSNVIHPQILLSFAIVVVLLVAGMLAVNYSAKSLLKYLYKVMEAVSAVKEDNFEIQIDDTSGDEIGDLAKSINQMLQKIQMLITEVYKEKLEKKNLELNLLQSKINPHFLYNNLSAINWIAIEKGEDQIYEITTQLAAFYRTALNKGINIDRLSVEVENIKAYIRLQMISHEEGFDVEFDLDESLVDRMIPIFIMQPLVENSIEHGIDTLREKRGLLTIKIDEQMDAIHILIRDNGTALYEKIGANTLTEQAYGYGVSNVDKRIRLLCGEAYGVTITADQEGTAAEIRIREAFISFDR